MYMVSNTMLSPSLARQIVDNTDKDKVTTLPPVKPKAGEVYDLATVVIYRIVMTGKVIVTCGSKEISVAFQSQKSFCTTKYCISQGLGDRVGSNEFSQTVYFLETNRVGLTVCMIHYLGNEAVYQERPHGNSKTNRNHLIEQVNLL